MKCLPGCKAKCDFDNDVTATCLYALRHREPDQFHGMVKMHVSFLLDLNTDDCNCKFIEDELPLGRHPDHQTSPTVASDFESAVPRTPMTAGKKKQAKSILSSATKSSRMPFSATTSRTSSGVGSDQSKSGYFGSKLTMEGVCQIYQIVEYLSRDYNITTEGIFRKTGNLKKQAALKACLNRGVVINLDDGDYSVHECAGVLKLFLAEMTEPLLTDAQYAAHCQVASMTTTKDAADGNSDCDVVTSGNALFDKKVQCLQLLFLLIPEAHYKLTQDLLLFLHRVASHSDRNRMCPSNLGTMFAPLLLCPRQLSAESLQARHQLLSSSVEFMIRNAHLLFRLTPALCIDIQSYMTTGKGTTTADTVPATPRSKMVANDHESAGLQYPASEMVTPVRKGVTRRACHSPLPDPVVARVGKKSENENASPDTSPSTATPSVTSDVPGATLSEDNTHSPVVHTVFSFVDRTKTHALMAETTTEAHLAQLYAQVQMMPESANKRRLVSKLNEANGHGTPGRLCTPRAIKSALTSRFSSAAGASHHRATMTPSITRETRNSRQKHLGGESADSSNTSSSSASASSCAAAIGGNIKNLIMPKRSGNMSVQQQKVEGGASTALTASAVPKSECYKRPVSFANATGRSEPVQPAAPTKFVESSSEALCSNSNQELHVDHRHDHTAALPMKRAILDSFMEQQRAMEAGDAPEFSLAHPPARIESGSSATVSTTDDGASPELRKSSRLKTKDDDKENAARDRHPVPPQRTTSLPKPNVPKFVNVKDEKGVDGSTVEGEDVIHCDSPLTEVCKHVVTSIGVGGDDNANAAVKDSLTTPRSRRPFAAISRSVISNYAKPQGGVVNKAMLVMPSPCQPPVYNDDEPDAIDSAADDAAAASITANQMDSEMDDILQGKRSITSSMMHILDGHAPVATAAALGSDNEPDGQDVKRGKLSNDDIVDGRIKAHDKRTGGGRQQQLASFDSGLVLDDDVGQQAVSVVAATASDSVSESPHTADADCGGVPVTRRHRRCPTTIETSL